MALEPLATALFSCDYSPTLPSARWQVGPVTFLDATDFAELEAPPPRPSDQKHRTRPVRGQALDLAWSRGAQSTARGAYMKSQHSKLLRKCVADEKALRVGCDNIYEERCRVIAIHKRWQSICPELCEA
eukprot:scaffold6428_cov58-Phaeocystis_antarctica.AAC.2